MASVKNVKRELHKAIDSVVEDCFLYLYLFPEREADLLDVIDDAIALRRGAIKGLNATPESKDSRRGYYSRLKKELRAQLMQQVERVCTLSTPNNK